VGSPDPAPRRAHRARLMRVGVVTTSYPRWPGDAAGGFVAAHAAALVAARPDVTVEVVAAAAPGIASRPDVVRVPAPAGLFYAGGAPDALEAGAATQGALGFATRLAATVARRACHWDAVIAHWLVPSALAALPTRGPLLAIAHGGDVHLLAARRLLVPTVAALALRGARVVFVAAALRDRTRAALPAPLARWLDDASLVQSMGVDVEWSERTAPAPTARPRLLVLARLVPIKGVDVLLRALDHVATPLDVIIAGDGPARAALTSLATAAPPRHHVTLVGELRADARDAELARATLVVIPSRPLPDGRAEGQPLVALEALAAGVPLVVTRTGGLAALVPPVVTVAPDDPRALAAGITASLAAPAPAAALTAAARAHAWAVVEPRLRAHWRLRPAVRTA